MSTTTVTPPAAAAAEPPAPARPPRRAGPLTWLSRAKLVLGAVVGLVAAGFAGAIYLQRYATHDEMTRAVAPASALTSEVNEHDRRLARLEVDLGWIKQTLAAIAARIGATFTPPPGP